MSQDTTEERIRHFDFITPAALTLRAAGDMAGGDQAAITRRDEIFREYCRGISRWSHSYILPHQVHKRRVRIVRPRTDHSRLHATDGLLSNSTLHSLAVVVADCLPIYIAVPTHGIIGLLHSGRRSTGILGRALTLLRRRYHIAASDVHLLFGPAIASCCYEVGREVADPYRARWGEGAVVERDGRYYLDLVCANQRIAESAGAVQVSVVEGCTHCDTRYHSHRRRDTAGGEQRMMALIAPFEQ